MRLRDYPSPRAGKGEAVVQVGHVGICGSELEGYLGLSSLRTPPLVMGHEFWGRVAEVGEDVDPAWRGQAVAVNPLVGCGRCSLCADGLSYLCPDRRLIGAHRPGAFAERVAVPASALVPVPEELAGPAGALVEPTAVALHAIRLAGLGLGETAVVVGAGTIGLLLTRLASAAGVRVVAVDTHPGRLELAARMGAWQTLRAGEEDLVGRVRAVAGHLAVRVAFDAVGRNATRALAVQVVRPGGTAVLVGIHDPDTPFPANDLVRWEVQVRGSYTYAAADFRDAVGLVREGLVAPAGWTQVRPLADGPEAFRELVDAPPQQPKILLAVGP